MWLVFRNDKSPQRYKNRAYIVKNRDKVRCPLYNQADNQCKNFKEIKIIVRSKT